MAGLPSRPSRRIANSTASTTAAATRATITCIYSSTIPSARGMGPAPGGLSTLQTEPSDAAVSAPRMRRPPLQQGAHRPLVGLLEREA